MTEESFQSGWERLLSNFELSDRQERNIQAIMREYWRVYQRSYAWFWNQLIDRAITDPGRRFLPTVGEMEAMASELRESNRSNPNVDRWIAEERAENEKRRPALAAGRN